MKITLILFFIFALIIPITLARADNTQLPRYLERAHDLLAARDARFNDFFNDTNIRFINTPDTPLARYTPLRQSSKMGLIELRDDIHPYRKDYAMMSSTIDRSVRPDFEDYMTMQATLSLSNEFAHYTQDKSGSLRDFIMMRDSQTLGDACALYDLQQFVSDIVMFETAYKLDQFFRKENLMRGSLSIQMVLEKMWLDDLFWDYRIARASEKNSDILKIFNSMFRKRHALNRGKINCGAAHSGIIADDVFNRAVTPVPDFLKPLIHQAIHPIS